MLFRSADQVVVGTAPELRSSVIADAIRADAVELPTLGRWAHELTQPAALLAAPRGLLGEPSPMQPPELCEGWAADHPDRAVQLVEVVNHYTITLGTRGARATAEAIASALNGC